MNDGINNPPPKAIEMGTTASDFQNLHELVAKARANLNQNAWDYIVGGTETETTLRRNRMALDEIAFRPRVLRDVGKTDASVQAMGRKLRPAGGTCWRQSARWKPSTPAAAARWCAALVRSARHTC